MRLPAKNVERLRVFLTLGAIRDRCELQVLFSQVLVGSKDGIFLPKLAESGPSPVHSGPGRTSETEQLPEKRPVIWCSETTAKGVILQAR